LPLTRVKPVQNWSDLLKGLMSGEAILFLDGVNKALKIDVSGGEKRSITEPQTEVSIFGPKDSFTESIVTNTALIRKRIHNPNLWLESFTIGKVSQTTVQIMYIYGIVNDKIVKEVRKRIKQRINTDQILDPSFIRQFIEDKTFTSFPTVYYTERPDRVTANIMEGRIAIFVDGSPFAITVPALFVEFFQSVDDYYARFDISFFLRILRVGTFFIAMVLPSAYVAITTFHQEM
jgi:spore germination protein KA